MSCATYEPGECVELEEFLPYVLPQAPNAPAEMVAHYIRLAAIQLCRETGLLQRDVAMDVQAGVQDYCMEVDGCGETIISVREVCLNGMPLPALRSKPCAGACPGSGYFYTQPHELLIWPAPSCDAALGLTAVVNTIPGQDTCALPRVLYDNWAEVVGDGAASKLLLVKGADWYDTQAAGIYLKRYLNGKRDAKNSVARGNVRGATIMRTRRWV